MAIKDRSGGRNWVPGIFAGFWILLAVFSGAYLFRIITEPQAQRAESAVASPATAAAPAAPAAPVSVPSERSEQRAEALIQASEAKDREIGELRAAVQDLSGQVTALSGRLKPLEKVLGPVAALPSSTSVTTSPPSPEPNMPIAKPPEVPKPSVSAAPATPPSVTVDEPSPAKPVEKPVVAAPKQPTPEEDDASAAPPDEATAEARPGDPSPPEEDAGGAPGPVTAGEPDGAAEGGSTETAALTPPSSIPPGTTRFGIEIGSVGKQEEIKPLWRGLLTNHAALVAGLQPRRVMAPDKKWRLIAGPFSSAAEAMQACGLFKKADMPCEATVYAGDAF
ncbi:MAG TPA: SPOR domain-containing protein [Methyloceanibacter sp.]|nr:SPOR domain-containing protein [Methyloceanibacter sp.]